MIPTRRAISRFRIALTVACLVLAGAMPTALAAAAEAKIVYTHEGVKEYEKQLDAGEVQAAVFNKKIRSLHLTLKNGTHMLVKYSPHEEPKLDSQLKAKGVTVAILKPAEANKEVPKTAVHHKLRYIAGGILLAVVIIVGIVLFIDRRRKAAREY